MRSEELGVDSLSHFVTAPSEREPRYLPPSLEGGAELARRRESNP